MKKIAFKAMSVLLATVLLVAALPIAAFAEDVSPWVIVCPFHVFDSSYEEIIGVEAIPSTNEASYTYHYQVVHRHNVCSSCGHEEIDEIRYLQEHKEVSIGAGVSQCTLCNSLLFDIP